MEQAVAIDGFALRLLVGQLGFGRAGPGEPLLGADLVVELGTAIALGAVTSLRAITLSCWRARLSMAVSTVTSPETASPMFSRQSCASFG
ncbi:MAG: hypothetical protein IID48_03075 [Proteobacteria bacterium]|nr:hypothetical protein [Pseudomonadota bacterium]